MWISFPISLRAVVALGLCASFANISRADLVAGHVGGSDDPLAPWVMDGTVHGISLESPVVVTGFVKGTGTFDNVVFDGYYAPGHSPALVTLGNTIYTASNVLEMEIGGLSPGSQHDKIDHNGMAALGGTLDVVLINAFGPQLGNSFDLFDWNAGNSGTFATINLPTLQSGLAWDASDLYVGGVLVVTSVPEVGGFWLIGICVCAVTSATAFRRIWQSIARGAPAPPPPRAAGSFGGNHMKVLMRRLILTAVATTTLFVAGRSARAATHTWNGNINSMSTGTWIGGVPTSGDTNLTLVFPLPVMMITTNLNQDIANPLEVQTLQIDGSYNFNGNEIRLKNLGAAPTIEMPGNNFLNISFGAPLDFNTATTISNTGTTFKNVSFDTLSGAGVTFDGTGGAQYLLFGTTANTLTGANFVKGVSQLRLQKTANTAAIGGSLTVDGAFAAATTLAANQFAAGTDISVINSGSVGFNNFAQSIDDLVVESSGSLTLGATGSVTINGQISSGAGVGTIGIGLVSSTVDFAGQFKTVSVTSTGVNDKLQIRDPIVNGSINKTGIGKLEVSNTNNMFTGTNTVAAGTLMGSPQSVGTVTVATGATLEFNDMGSLAANQVTGLGQVVITNTVVDYQNTQTYSGGTVLNGGSAMGTAATLLGNFSSTVGGSLQFQQNTNATWTGTLSGLAALNQFGSGVLSLGGNNPYTSDTFVSNGGINLLSDTAIGTGTLQIQGGSIEATGTRSLANPLALGSSTFAGSGNFNFTNTATKTPGGNTTHTSTGMTNIAGQWINANNTITVNAGQLAIGDSAIVNGFTSTGPIVVNGGVLTLRSLNFITLPDVTLAGGTLNTPNGYAIPLGAVLQGNGAVTGRVASANGSSILANNNLTIGDSAHVAGVNLDGELYTNKYAVTLNDSNQAVLGSLTNLGDGTNNGTLNAPDGLVVNFGRNITGRGQINSTNTLAKAVIINGDVQGDSFANFLEFTGYVKGVGTFDNVAFSGTFAPGLSPAVVSVGNVALGASSVLDMEIGGTDRGSEYDGIDIAGTMSLNGELKLSLLNGFTPSLGNEWQLLNGPTSGMFASYDFPILAEGLTWNTSELYSEGTLSVVAGLTGDFNGDGTVDPADYVLWRNGLGSTHAPADFGIWQANFGHSSGASGSVAAAVPEPTTQLLAIALLCAAAFARNRR